jgi:hypothetical protein
MQAETRRKVTAFITAKGGHDIGERRELRNLLEPACRDVKRMLDSDMLYRFKRLPEYDVAGELMGAVLTDDHDHGDDEEDDDDLEEGSPGIMDCHACDNKMVGPRRARQES